MLRKHTLGIDLGTTNTVIARNCSAIPMANGQCVLPSVVAYPPNGATEVGRRARRRRAIDPKNTIVSAKRVIGARWHSSYATLFRAHYPYELEQRPDGGIAFRTRVGPVTPRDVGHAIVDEICARTAVSTRGVHAVVTAPVAFDPRRLNATREAVSRANFASVRLIEEPIATAMAYLSRSNVKYGVVYDLGGGTFDIAVVDCSRYPFRVLAHRGDPYLGGDDIDRRIAQQVAERAIRQDGWDLQNDPVIFNRLVVAAEVAKCELAEVNETAIAVSQVDPAAPQSCGVVVITRAEVQSMTLDLARRTFSLCDEVLAEAQLKTRDVDAVFLAGGSTRLPGLRCYIEAYFNKRPRSDLDPMHVVAMGASLAAARQGVSDLVDVDLDGCA